MPEAEDLRSLPFRPETVFIAGGHSGSKKLLRECLEREVPCIVLGGRWAQRMRPSLLREARTRKVRIIGPGSQGILFPEIWPACRGNSAVFAEGGDLLRAAAAEAFRRSVPFRYCLSFGESWDYSPLEAARLILEQDAQVVLFAFVLRDILRGRDLLDFASLAAREGKRTAVLSLSRHGPASRVEEAVFRQYGIAVLEEPFQLVDAAAAFAAFGRPRRFSCSLSSGSRELGDLLSALAEREFPSLPAGGSEDEMLAIHSAEEGDTREKLESTAGRWTREGRTCLFTAAGGSPELEERTGAAALPFVAGFRRCLKAVSLLDSSDISSEAPGAGPAHAPSRRRTLPPCPTEYDAKTLLRAYGIPIAREKLCHSLGEARRAAEIIGFPVALKVMSPNIVNKTEARVIALNLQDAEELRNAYGRTLEKARLADPGGAIRGVLVQEMIRGGLEWRMEFRLDARFGPVVETGISGVYREILPDGVLRAAPFSVEEAMKMIRESRGCPLLLEGWRRDRLDMESLAAALAAFSRLAAAERGIGRLEVNPLFVNVSGVLVVDAFIKKKRGR